jgi:phage virion morphogenesis protein
MAGARVVIDDREVIEALKRFERASGDLHPMLADIGEALLISHRARFDAQVDPEGNPWAPLSEEYAARKARNADKILILDSYLKDLLRYQVTPSAMALELGTDRIYGATHQFGDEERGIPARPYLGLSDADRSEVLRIVTEYLGDPLRPK